MKRVRFFTRILTRLEKVWYVEDLQDNSKDIGAAGMKIRFQEEPRAEMLNSYHQQSHQCTLQQSGQHVAPVMFVIGHPRQPRVHGGGDQEKL